MRNSRKQQIRSALFANSTLDLQNVSPLKRRNICLLCDSLDGEHLWDRSCVWVLLLDLRMQPCWTSHRNTDITQAVYTFLTFWNALFCVCPKPDSSDQRSARRVTGRLLQGHNKSPFIVEWFSVSVCQETVWEAFKIFWDRLPERDEYQDWVGRCMDGSVSVTDIGRFFSQSEEHISFIRSVSVSV